MTQSTPVDHLAAHARRKVRAVARENGPHANQLFEMAKGKRKHWNFTDWQRVLRELDACTQSVEAWRLTHE